MTKTNWTGEFQAVGNGTAWITGRTYNGKEASCKIVVKAGKKIYLSPSNQLNNYYSWGNTTERDQCNIIAEATKKSLERCGFEVKKAQKQFGQIHIVKSQNADFNVLPNYGASGALENSPDDGADVYSFFSQPFLMTVEESVREKVVDVRPEYLTTVDCDELKLRARYLYSVYGSKLHELRMSLNGWRLSV